MQLIEGCTCGAVLPLENAARFEIRTPYPSCGSTIRVFKQLLEAETLSLKTSFGLKAKSAGRRIPWYELLNGADWSRTFQKFMQKTRIIDRRSDHYSEVVEDPDTGNVIRRCSEPLTQHQNHGSARKAVK